MVARPNEPRGRRLSSACHALLHGLMTLFAGPFVLVALMLSIVLLAFNVWPTFHRFSEWGD